MNKYFSFLVNRLHNKYLLIRHSLDIITMCGLSNLIFSMCIRQGLPCFPYSLVVQLQRFAVVFFAFSAYHSLIRAILFLHPSRVVQPLQSHKSS